MHLAQPGLVVAGPGTGTTWMVRQIVHSCATKLTDSDALGEGGVRLVPVIVFVQRIVRLLRDTGTDPWNVVKKRRMMIWYIENEFPGKSMKLFRDCLCQAYDMRALVILVDGVDEAASLRLHVEEFIHYELVPSGNRMLVTSRPDGITMPLYLTNFAVVSLRPLTESQQRRVAQSQMRGSAFYEHLVAITAARKRQDELWLEHYPTEAVRNKLEAVEFTPSAFTSSAAESTGVGRSSPTPNSDSTPPLSPVPPERKKMQIVIAKGSEIEEQTAIDTLDQIIRSVATESGMAPDDVENALSWLDESSADRMPRKMEMEEDIAAFARLELRGEEIYTAVLTKLIDGVEIEIVCGPDLDEKEKQRLAVFAPEKLAAMLDNKAKLTLLYLENRFAKFDPTHTRDILTYHKMRYKGQTLSCELQLIHTEILQVTERMDTYSHLRYFRLQAALKLEPGALMVPPAELDKKFEKSLLFAEEASGVPVLLSMFVLILVSGADDLAALPTSRLELYQTATDSALRRRIKRTLQVAPWIASDRLGWPLSVL